MNFWLDAVVAIFYTRISSTDDDNFHCREKGFLTIAVVVVVVVGFERDRERKML